MRKVDFWVGVPMCFALSLWRFARRLTGYGDKPRQALKNVLFIQLAETGGLVVACPAVAHLQRLFPEAQIHFLTFTLGGSVLACLGVPESRRIHIRTSSLRVFAVDTLRALRRMRAARIDTVINLETFARYSSVLAYLSAAPRRVGFSRFHDEGRYIGSLLTHPVQYTPHMHAARSYIALVEALHQCPVKLPKPGDPMVKRPVLQTPLDLPKADIPSAVRQGVEKKLRSSPGYATDHKLVLLNADASDLVEVKRWPQEHCVRLARMLLEDPDVLVVLTGAPEGRDHAAQLARTINHARVLNMAGSTTLAELLTLYSLGRLLITSDSAPAHFASLTDIPVIVLFGPETPHVYGPLGRNAEPVYARTACSPCVSAYNQKRSPCGDNQCMRLISPEYVCARARAILEGQSPRCLNY